MLGPLLFYVPKFFELRTVHSRLGLDVTVDCETVLNPPKINFTAFKGNQEDLVNNANLMHGASV